MRATPISALVTRDARSILRDPLLFFLLVYASLIALVTRLAVPYIPVEGIGLLLAPAVVIIATLLSGVVLGLSLVEERETQTWLLFRVLPAGGRTFVTYLITAAVTVAFVSAAICALVYGRPVVHPGVFFGALAAAAMGSPVFLLFLGAYASNKIEALAMQKIAGSITTVPILIFLLPAGWQWALWWNPWYWIYLGLLRGWATAADLRAAGIPVPVDADVAYSAIPIAMCLACCTLLARRYERLVQ